MSGLREVLVVCAVAGLTVSGAPAVATAAVVSPGSAGASAPRAGGAASAGVWGKALEVPGTRSLNTGGSASVDSMSCASPGDCTAVGTYATVGHYHQQVFVVSQVRGTWRKAVELPGLAALNKGRYAADGGVSCASRGRCSAGGWYTDGLGHRQAFVASRVRGRWHKAVQAPGVGALNAGGVAAISAIACASPGNCTAGGSYLGNVGGVQAFVISQVGGAWRSATPIPGLAALNVGGSAAVASISCASPRNCTAVGSYRDGKSTQAFAVSQVNRTWGQAIEVPGTAGLNTGGYAAMTAVSCASAGNCTAIGNVADSGQFAYPFVVSQVSGSWGSATKIPGMTAFNSFGAGQGYAISCGSAGDCVAAGSEGVNNGYDFGGGGKPFVVTQTNGIWGNARHLSGMKRLNTGVDGAVTSVSCPSPGNCSAAGYYGVGDPNNRVYNLEVFVVSESRGIWGRAREIPGTALLNKGTFAGVGALSCAEPGRCSVGGSYAGARTYGQAFVDTSS